MRKVLLAGPAMAAAALLLCVSASEAGVLVPIPPIQGSVSTFVAGINDKNVLTGDYETADGALHGWLGTMDGQYRTFDAPTGMTQGRGINNDGYITLSSAASGDRFFSTAMLRNPDGALVPIKMDGGIIDGFSQGIISRERSVGERWYIDQNQNLFIYGYYARGRKYKADLTLPFDVWRTRPRGYIGSGEVLGYMRYSTGPYRGFVVKDGVATDITYPDERAYYLYLEAVNGAGQIVGGWQDADGTVGNAFFYNLGNNSFDIIDVPGSAWANSLGINNNGIATIYSDVGSFIYCPKAKNCPGAAAGIRVKERHVTGGLARSAPCQHGCITPVPASDLRKPTDAAALREAIARDPELRRELRQPFRP
jgi:hypothetical protein